MSRLDSAAASFQVTAPVDCHRLSVAPMMDWTDRHCRFFLRQLTRHALLYTEMIAAPALLHGDAERLLAHSPGERPVALQLGGDDPGELAACARMGAEAGYAEIDLNVGCPSDRVQQRRIGACLMRSPEAVAEAVAAMQAAVHVPVTVKHRLGVDELDRYEDVARFVAIVAAAGCRRFVVHARKAWLAGLSPKQNREIPPLRPAEVHRLKRDFPALAIEINGGIGSLDEVERHLADGLDGVMLGRAAYHDPYLLAAADRRIFGDPTAATPSREEVVERLLPYVEGELAAGTPLPCMTRHLLGLFHGQPGGRRWRRVLSEGGRRPGAGAELLREALPARRSQPLRPLPAGAGLAAIAAP